MGQGPGHPGGSGQGQLGWVAMCGLMDGCLGELAQRTRFVCPSSLAGELPATPHRPFPACPCPCPALPACRGAAWAVQGPPPRARRRPHPAGVSDLALRALATCPALPCLPWLSACLPILPACPACMPPVHPPGGVSRASQWGFGRWAQEGVSHRRMCTLQMPYPAPAPLTRCRLRTGGAGK